MTKGFSTVLFWDIDIKTFDIDKHARFLIERVVTRGTLDDWHLLKKTYSREKIKEEALQIRTLDKISLNFLSIYFKIAPEKFRCYKQTQSPHTHWNY